MPYEHMIPRAFLTAPAMPSAPAMPAAAVEQYVRSYFARICDYPLASKRCIVMSFVPRRRLVLASARSAGVHTHWSTSQMPWDAEEGAFADDNQTCTRSQNVCFTQENALTVQQQADWGLQLDHLCHKAVYADAKATEQAPDGLYVIPSCDHASSSQQHSSHAAALDQLILSREDYSDMYSFLTKNSGHVQEMSAKERSLFKLSDLRQVTNLTGLLLFLGLDMIQLPFAGHEIAWCVSRWQN